MEFLMALAFCAVSGVIGFFIGRMQGRPMLGLWLGFILGPVGWLISLLVGKPAVESPRLSGHFQKQDPLEAWEMSERVKEAPPVPRKIEE